MTDFSVSWNLSRGRFDDALSGLNQEQLNWSIHPATLTAGQMAAHVAGVEVSFISQLTGISLDELGLRLKSAATDGVVNDKPVPFSQEELTPAKVAELLAYARAMAGPVIAEPSPEVLKNEIVSALGPIITGQGALARLAFHSAYHQGQVHVLVTSPGFPG